jgi:hypothetical protein
MAVLQLTATSLRIPPESGYNPPNDGLIAFSFDPLRYLHLGHEGWQGQVYGRQKAGREYRVSGLRESGVAERH